jgi:epoxide hydrolase-like predicted phosphatase
LRFTISIFLPEALENNLIKAVIFDVGGVIIRTEDRKPRADLEQQFGLAPGQAEQLVLNSEMGRRAQLGLITAADLWDWVQQQFSLSAAGLRDFQQAFWGGDRIDQPLVDFIRSLRPRYQTAIISNAMDNLNEVVAQFDPTGTAFDLVVGSAYEKVMKPDTAIFERTLARLGRQPAEAVFIDDFTHNITGAQAAGIAGILFRPGMELAVELAKLGVVLT